MSVEMFDGLMVHLIQVSSVIRDYLVGLQSVSLSVNIFLYGISTIQLKNLYLKNTVL